MDSTGNEIEEILGRCSDAGFNARHLHQINGAWRSLVAHLVWDQTVAGSNPAAPTSQKKEK